MKKKEIIEYAIKMAQEYNVPFNTRVDYYHDESVKVYSFDNRDFISLKEMMKFINHHIQILGYKEELEEKEKELTKAQDDISNLEVKIKSAYSDRDSQKELLNSEIQKRDAQLRDLEAEVKGQDVLIKVQENKILEIKKKLRSVRSKLGAKTREIKKIQKKYVPISEDMIKAASNEQLNRWKKKMIDSQNWLIAAMIRDEQKERKKKVILGEKK